MWVHGAGAGQVGAENDRVASHRPLLSVSCHTLFPEPSETE